MVGASKCIVVIGRLESLPVASTLQLGPPLWTSAPIALPGQREDGATEGPVGRTGASKGEDTGSRAKGSGQGNRGSGSIVGCEQAPAQAPGTESALCNAVYGVDQHTQCIEAELHYLASGKV